MNKTPAKASLPRRILSCLLAVVLAAGLAPALPRVAQAEEAQARAFMGFEDVQPGDWYAIDEVLGYAVDNGLLQGYDDGRFGPYDDVTRGQVATILWRIAGEPSADAEDFSDVDYSLWYGAAVEWARTSGVVSGYGDTNTFGPDNPVTREQLAVMLSNYAVNVAGVDASSDCAALDAIAGAEGVSSWAREQMGWAVDEGILSGSVVDGVAWVDPQGTAQRCQAAKMVSVFHRDVLGAGEEDVVDYADGVKLVGGYESASEDGTAVVLPASQADGVQPGDVVLADQTFEHPSGLAVKVESVERQGSNVVVTGSRPESIREVYDDYDVTETLTVDASTFRPASGARLMDPSEVSGAQARATVEPGLIAIDLSTIGEVAGMTFDGFVTVLPTFTVDVDVSKWYFYAGASGPAQVNATVSGSIAEERIPLGTGVAMGDDDTGASVGLFLVVSADGSLHVEQSYQFDVGIGTDSEKDSRFDASDPVLEASVDAKVGPSLEARVSVVGFAICDLGVDGGVKVSADIAYHEGLTCVDTLATVYMGATYKVLGDFSIPGTDGEDVVFDESNSPVRIEAHWENGALVPECTWGESGDGDDPTIVPGDDDYQPEFEDEGYGTVPILSTTAEGCTSGYGNKLANRFYVNAGTSITVGPYNVGSISNALALGYHGEPGTVLRITRYYDDGTSSQEITGYYNSSSWYINGGKEIEVLSGRLTFYRITAWQIPPVSFGSCETISYPLRVSADVVNMSVGQKVQVKVWDEYKSLGCDDIFTDFWYRYSCIERPENVGFSYDCGWAESEEAIFEFTATAPGKYVFMLEKQGGWAERPVTFVVS